MSETTSYFTVQLKLTWKETDNIDLSFLKNLSYFLFNGMSLSFN